MIQLAMVNHTDPQSKYIDLQAHYTDALEIKTLMVDLLGDVQGKKILEPSVGSGALINSLVGTPSRVDVVDIDVSALYQLKEQFGSNNLRIIHADFISLFVDNEIELASTLCCDYDAVIANPPYGLEIPIPVRKRIKAIYQDIYARESYGLFLYFSLRRLREGARYVFLLPDTFIFSANHRPLRAFLSVETQITEIIQFNSKRFMTVNYGYSGMCTIAGFLGKNHVGDMRWLDMRKSDETLNINALNSATIISKEQLIKFATNGWHGLLSSSNTHVCRQILTLNDYAECKTGIYTGDNKKFLGYRELKRRGAANGHPINWDNNVCTRELTAGEMQNGIDAGPTYVPLIRGGHRNLFDETSWAINWSKEAVLSYRNNRKARLQNQGFYFRRGIAAPMVTSNRLTASIMDQSIFDQGVVGIFPKKLQTFNAILLYLNSTFVSVKLKPLVNPSANNSANYLKKLPIKEITQTTIDAANKLMPILRGVEQSRINTFINRFVDEHMSFTI